MSTANDAADLSPLFVEFRPGMRKRIAAAVDALVALLDQMDGDADFECGDPLEDDSPAEESGDDEPNLGSAGSTALSWSYSQIGWAQGTDDDREVEDEHDEPRGDDEPALGATAAMNQEHAWRAKLNAWGSSDEAEASWAGRATGGAILKWRCAAMI
jgi:hypothetical protein